MKNNPFVLPGFGQTGSLSENPILASMEMMRQAWEGLASSGNMDAAAMGKLMSVEEMDKRVSDLRAVENWLSMNLTMLRSTIQGLEVQRATLATLKSFAEGGMGSTAHAAQGTSDPGRTRGRSPLDEVLKSWPGPPQTEGHAQPQSQAPSQDHTETGDDSATNAESTSQPETSPQQDDVLAAAATAAQGWWDVMQQQFQTLAAATAASAEGTMAEMQEAAARTSKQAAAGTATGSSKPAKKAAGAKTAAKKAAKASKAVKSAGTTRASRSTTAVKKASKSATPRKTTR